MVQKDRKNTGEYDQNGTNAPFLTLAIEEARVKSKISVLKLSKEMGIDRRKYASALVNGRGLTERELIIACRLFGIHIIRCSDAHKIV